MNYQRERYEMLINHALRQDEFHVMQFHVIDVGHETHYLFEVRCSTCGWWDHWDERKEDWVQPKHDFIDPGYFYECINEDRNRAAERIHTLLDGTANEFDNVYQILDMFAWTVKAVVQDLETGDIDGPTERTIQEGEGNEERGSFPRGTG